LRIIPKEAFCLSSISEIDISGRGGCEQVIGDKIIPIAERVSAPLHDFEMLCNGNKSRIEVKKQENDQWFDIAKYHDLSSEDRDVIMLFVLHRGGRITHLALIRLGELLDLLLSNSSFRTYGWTEYAIETAHKLVQESPQLQFKAKLKVRDLIKKFPDYFQFLYEAS